MIKPTRTATILILALTLITGVIYPLAMTGIAQLFVPDKADGSLITRDGEVLGSELIGQSFIDEETGYTLPGYFRGRPSAIDYDAGTSGGSNLGPTNADLRDRVENDLSIIKDENDLPESTKIPVDLVTASGSGLDPHISIDAARLQVPRVASERGISEDEVNDLIDSHTEGRELGFLGEPRVNVVTLNLELDERFPLPVGTPSADLRRPGNGNA